MRAILHARFSIPVLIRRRVLISSTSPRSSPASASPRSAPVHPLPRPRAAADSAKQVRARRAGRDERRGGGADRGRLLAARRRPPSRRREGRTRSRSSSRGHEPRGAAGAEHQRDLIDRGSGCSRGAATAVELNGWFVENEKGKRKTAEARDASATAVFRFSFFVPLRYYCCGCGGRRRPTSSTSKVSVAFGGITPPAPVSP